MIFAFEGVTRTLENGIVIPNTSAVGPVQEDGALRIVSSGMILSGLFLEGAIVGQQFILAAGRLRTLE